MVTTLRGVLVRGIHTPTPHNNHYLIVHTLLINLPRGINLAHVRVICFKQAGVDITSQVMSLLHEQYLHLNFLQFHD